MKLHFSQHIKDKPTHFVEKIWKGLKTCISQELYIEHEKRMSHEKLTKQYEVDIEVYEKVLPKIHTIRKDLKKDWHVGKPINFLINFRGNKTVYFAPVL
ncbi:hypothetical protein ACFP6C_03060, partial [Flavobacterium psychroterrae]